MQAVIMELIKWAMQFAPDIIVTIFTIIIAPNLVRWISKNAKAKDLELINQGAEVAYQVVNQIARRTPGQVDDKAAEALRIMKEQLKVVKTPAQEVVALNALRAVHERQRVEN